MGLALQALGAVLRPGLCHLGQWGVPAKAMAEQLGIFEIKSPSLSWSSASAEGAPVPRRQTTGMSIATQLIFFMSEEPLPRILAVEKWTLSSAVWVLSLTPGARTLSLALPLINMTWAAHVYWRDTFVRPGGF